MYFDKYFLAHALVDPDGVGGSFLSPQPLIDQILKIFFEF